jgi:prephenate dehydrogenase
MKINIIGRGAFGSFLMGLVFKHGFEFDEKADTVILAVPISAYSEVARANAGKHLINVCSVQRPSMDICLKHSDRVTGIHPLFGSRTPSDRWNSILTYTSIKDNDTWYSADTAEAEFIRCFSRISTIMQMAPGGVPFTPEIHDVIMAKTHVAAVMAAKQLQVYCDRAKDIPDYMVPNSFRLLREFVKTLEDMPPGTIESIMANPYI